MEESSAHIGVSIDISYGIIIVGVIYAAYMIYKKKRKKKCKRVKVCKKYKPCTQYVSVPDIVPQSHFSIPAKLGEMAGTSVSTHSGRIVAAPFVNPYCY